MILSPIQERALKEVEHWFNNESDKKQVFKLFGVAGTGKSTLAKYFAENVKGTVKFAAFTGKAAHVMAKKGCVGATTIHQMIYRPKPQSRQRLWELEEELEKLKSQPNLDHEKLQDVQEAINIEKENAGRLHFALNSDSDLRHADLLIIDEVSMLNEQLGKDLESFGIPILVLGDPEQLPPIYGAGYFTESAPDIMLNEVHRQALDNPIIQMANLVRSGKPLPLGSYGESRVINTALDAKEIIGHDIILTGLRKTKKACDDKCRMLLGWDNNPLPKSGDRLMCVKNNHMIGLLNGQIWISMLDATSLGSGLVSLFLRNEESGEELAVTAAEKSLLGIPLERYEHEQGIEEFEYAYAITVHKSQGSQWNNVLVFDQKDKFPNWSDRDRRRWLYTGITRAVEKVTVMRL